MVRCKLVQCIEIKNTTSLQTSQESIVSLGLGRLEP